MFLASFFLLSVNYYIFIIYNFTAIRYKSVSFEMVYFGIFL